MDTGNTFLISIFDKTKCILSPIDGSGGGTAFDGQDFKISSLFECWITGVRPESWHVLILARPVVQMSLGGKEKASGRPQAWLQRPDRISCSLGNSSHKQALHLT